MQHSEQQSFCLGSSSTNLLLLLLVLWVSSCECDEECIMVNMY